MNWDRIEGNWHQFLGSAREKWGRLSRDQLATIAGKREVLAGRIQECYGLTREDTERQISEWQDMQKATTEEMK